MECPLGPGPVRELYNPSLFLSPLALGSTSVPILQEED